MVGGEAGNAISKFCAGRTTKNEWVDHSAEPFIAHWDGEIANKSLKRNKFRHVKTQKYKEWTGEKMECDFKPKQNGWWRDR